MHKLYLWVGTWDFPELEDHSWEVLVCVKNREKALEKLKEILSSDYDYDGADFSKMRLDVFLQEEVDGHNIVVSQTLGEITGE